MSIFRRYQQAIVTAMASLAVGGTLLFTGATFFHRADTADTKAESAQDHTATNASKIKVTQQKTRVIEHVLISKGILRRGPRGITGGRGPIGVTGATGPRGATGKPGQDFALSNENIIRLAHALTDAQLAQIVTIICVNHPCRGVPGQNGTDGKDAVTTTADLDRIADMICGRPAPCPPAPGATGPAGPAGPQGVPGPAPASFGFSPPPTGPHYTCTDPESDGTYACVPDA